MAVARKRLFIYNNPDRSSK